MDEEAGSPLENQAELDVVISVVSHNNPALVRTCLRSMEGACAGLRWTAVVVENMPRAGPPLTAEFPWARVVKNDIPVGFGQNHNAVLERVVASDLARYVLVLNDDTELHAGSIAALVRHADEHRILGATSPRLLWPDGTRQQSLYSFPTLPRAVRAAFNPRRLPDVPIQIGPGWLRGACLLLRTEALRRVGLFDTQYFLFFEDVDLAARLYAAGWEVDVCEASSVIHLGHETITQPELRLPMDRQMLRSGYLYFKKHRGKVAAAVLVASGRCGLLLRAIASRFRADEAADHARQASASYLFSLARYVPTVPLPHELRARRAGRGEGCA